MNANRLKKFKNNRMNRSYNESTLRVKIQSRHKYKLFFADVSFKGVNNEEGD